MEITRENFRGELENITENLKLSCFVGFDAEFTALLSGDRFKYRLFDTNEERYNLIKNKVSKMIMTQVGLTMFQYDRENCSYMAVGYTFHLCPQAVADINQSFIFRASTLQFLCRHNFNFNKFIYNGIPYLSKAEEAHIREQLKHKTLLGNLIHGMTIDEERKLQKHCSEVSKWLIENNEETLYLDVECPIMRYIVHNEIRDRFPGVLTTDSLGNSNKVLIYRDRNVKGANSAPSSILEENLMSHLLGFSQIINLLATHQKPIIGHNNYLDLVLLYSQFIGPLPNKYCTFKKNINSLFPMVFDTKYISHEMGRKLTYSEVWKSNVLQDLYEFYSNGKCKKLERSVNLIKLSTPFDVKQSYHEAGWDSYCSGYCFIRMGHWAACENIGKYRLVGPKEKLAALAPYCNKVNVIRGAVPFVNLVDVDPPRHRPELLHIKSMKERIINVAKVTSVLAGFGSIDVKPYGRKSALIATGSKNTSDKILKQFKNNRDYKVAPFNVIRHSPAGRMAIWGSALLTGSLILYLLHRRVNN